MARPPAFLLLLVPWWEPACSVKKRVSKFSNWPLSVWHLLHINTVTIILTFSYKVSAVGNQRQATTAQEHKIQTKKRLFCSSVKYAQHSVTVTVLPLHLSAIVWRLWSSAALWCHTSQQHRRPCERIAWWCFDTCRRWRRRKKTKRSSVVCSLALQKSENSWLYLCLYNLLKIQESSFQMKTCLGEFSLRHGSELLILL